MKPKVKRQSTSAAKPEPESDPVGQMSPSRSSTDSKVETNEGGSGGGSSQKMEKNEQGDEYLKVSFNANHLLNPR